MGTWLIARMPKHFLAGQGRTLYNAVLVRGSSFWALLPSFPTKNQPEGSMFLNGEYLGLNVPPIKRLWGPKYEKQGYMDP